MTFVAVDKNGTEMKKRHIKIERAKNLESSISMFSEPRLDEFKEGIWELRNEDGSVHEDSDELVKAVKALHEAQRSIKRILKS